MSRAIVDRFAEAGGTFIDTAASYQVGESEENLGRILAGRRDEFTVATKFAIGGSGDGDGVLQTGNGRRAMFRSVEASLRRSTPTTSTCCGCTFPTSSPRSTRSSVPSTISPAREGALRRALELPGVDDIACGDPCRAARPAADRGRAVRIQPRRAKRRPGQPADGGGARHRCGAVVATRWWAADGQVPHQQRGQADRVESLGTQRRRAGQGRDGRRRARRSGAARRPAGPGRGGVAAGAGQALPDRHRAGDRPTHRRAAR